MRLVQVVLPGLKVGVGVVEGNEVVVISQSDTELTLLNHFIDLAHEKKQSLTKVVAEALKKTKKPRAYLFDKLNSAPSAGAPFLTIPFVPPEVWGFGVTYKKSAQARDEETDVHRGMYDFVHKAKRPEVFFKATATRCVGPNAPIGLRRDSSYMAPEPELAYMVGYDGEIVGWTVCNDVSAWDIEKENPLYLPQSKIFSGCCAFGPLLVTSDEIKNPKKLAISCRILRKGKVIFEGETNSSNLKRSVGELHRYLYRHNPVPPCSLVTTGTGIVAPQECALKPGDVVQITIEKIGTLSNVAKKLD